MTGGIGLPSADRVEYIAHPVQVLARSVEMLRCQGRLPRSPLPNDKRRFWTSSAALVPSLRSSRSRLYHYPACLHGSAQRTDRLAGRSRTPSGWHLAFSLGRGASTAWSLSSVWKACLLCERPFANCLPTPPRLGSPGKFTAEQLAQIFAVACTKPEDSGRPVTHWTHADLAHEVAKRGIVTSISVRRILVACWMKRTSKPHRIRYWLNAKQKMIRLSPYRYN